ncbi:hypothetical protein GGI02_001772, partial [Coemansia sp. RSA 2322]
MDPSSSGGGTGGGGGSRTADDLFNFSQAAASMFMNGASGGGPGGNGASAGEHGMDEMWGMGDAANMFFNMDAFSSAPVSAIGNGTAAGSNIDLSTAFGLDMNGSSMDPEAWKMLLQGDPTMDDLFGGFSASVGAASTVAMGSLSIPGSSHSAMFGGGAVAPASMATLAPADLDALSRPQQIMSMLPSASLPSAAPHAAAPPSAAAQLKSPTPSAKKPRAPKPKKSASAVAPTTKVAGAGIEKPAPKSKAKKAATPKLKSPTPLPPSSDPTALMSPAGASPAAVGSAFKPPGGAPESPGTEAARRAIKPKAEGAAASPTPSTRSVQNFSSQQPLLFSPAVSGGLGGGPGVGLGVGAGGPGMAAGGPGGSSAAAAALAAASMFQTQFQPNA